MASNAGVDGPDMADTARRDAATEPADTALGYLDAILAAQPRADATLLSACTRSLARLRDAIILEQRAVAPDDRARARLAHVNAVISVVMAGHFPLGALPWDELHKARAWLAEL